MTRMNLGFGYLELGAYTDAETLVREALAAARRLGLHVVVAGAKANLTRILLRQNRIEEALRIADESVEQFNGLGNVRMEGAARRHRAEALARLGQLQLAEDEARRAVELGAVSPPLLPFATATLADVLHARGRTSEALAQVEEAIRLLEASKGVEIGESYIRLLHAEILHASGNESAAERALAVAKERLLARADRIKDPRWRASLLENVPENARTLQGQLGLR